MNGENNSAGYHHPDYDGAYQQHQEPARDCNVYQNNQGFGVQPQYYQVQQGQGMIGEGPSWQGQPFQSVVLRQQQQQQQSSNSYYGLSSANQQQQQPQQQQPSTSFYGSALGQQNRQQQQPSASYFGSSYSGQQHQIQQQHAIAQYSQSCYAPFPSIASAPWGVPNAGSTSLGMGTTNLQPSKENTVSLPDQMSDPAIECKGNDHAAAVEASASDHQQPVPLLHQYACLVDGCDRLFGKWGDCRKHMKKECGYAGPKPKIGESTAKGRSIIASNPELSADFIAQSTLPKPWENVSEEELVGIIRPYYERTDISAKHKRTQLATEVIRPRYGGNFPFAKFGYGSLEEFLEKHGIEEKGHMKKLKQQGAFSRRRKG